jgi:uncharacterized protein (TIGR03437 family)
MALAGVVCAPAQTAYRIQTLAGSNFAGDGGAAGLALLQQAEGIAAHPSDGTIYIADAGDHRIRAVSATGEIRTVAGDGTAGAEGDGGPAVKARLHSPYGLSIDRNGNLYIADLGNARIRRIAADGTIQTVAGGGEIAAADASEGSPATALLLKSPRNVLADANGGFYFSDFEAHRVYYVDFRGVLTIFAGTGNPGYGADNIPAARSALRNPAGLAFEPQGGVVIVESGSQRLRRVARGTVTSYLADALRNHPLYSPTGIAFDSAGNMYLADTRAFGALKRSPQGEITALAVAGRAVAAAPGGGAFYAWNNAVFRVEATNKVTAVAGTTAGTAEIIGDGGTAEAARLLAPSGLAYDREGNLYIADERAHRIRRVTPAGLITTFAGIGKAAYSGDGGPAVKAGLNAPRGLAFDSNGFLYVADAGNHAVRKIAPSGTIVSVAGNGFSGFRGDGGPATAALLQSPSGVAVDPNGDIFIADTANHRVRRINKGGVITTYAGSGTAGMAFEGSAAVFAQLNEPRGLAFDASGNLYIADSGNNRIRRVDLTGLLSTIGGPELTAPRGVAVAVDGSVYVADTSGHRIAQISDAGVTSIAGEGTAGFRGDGGPAAGAQFQFPAAVAFDSYGNLAVADLGNSRVRQLRPEALLIAQSQSKVRLYNAASNLEGPVAPGMLATLRGDSFGPLEPAAAPGGGSLPRLLADVDVYVDGEAAPLLYVSNEQINLQIPVSVAGRRQTRIEIYFAKTRRAELTVPVAETSLGLFPQVIKADGTVSGADNPVARGSVVTVFATGIGLLPAALTEVRIGAMVAQVLWAGPAPGVPGVLQVNFRLPSGFFPPGSQAVQLRAGAAATQAGVFVYLQ